MKNKRISLILFLLILISNTIIAFSYQESEEGWNIYYEGDTTLPYDSKYSLLINFNDKGETNYSIDIDFNETITLCIMNKSDVDEYHNTNYNEFDNLTDFHYVPKENDGSIKYSSEYNFTITLDNKTKYYLVIDNSEEFGVGSNSNVNGNIKLSYFYQIPEDNKDEDPLKLIFFTIMILIVVGIAILGILILVNKRKNSKNKLSYP